MNIIEAVTSGKRFRTTDRDGSWYFVGKDGGIKVQIEGAEVEAINVFLRKDLLLDDWEVEEEKKELSWNQIDEAIRGGLYTYREPWSPGLILRIKELLGFEIDERI